MSKNPFMNCKSRKRRKRPVTTKPKPQGYCPSSMIRYDNSPNTTAILWVCKMCLTCILSEKTVREHLLTCNPKVKQKKEKPQSSYFNITVEYTRHVCKYCNRDFTREVALKKHEEFHETPLSEEDSDIEVIVIDD